MLRKSLFLLALTSLGGMAHAGEKPLYAPVPAWVKAAAEPDTTKLKDEDPIFLILDQQQRLQDGESWNYVDSATRIASSQLLTEAGTIKLAWSPDAGDLTIHRAEILRSGERIDLLKAGQSFAVLRREEQLDQAWLDGTLTATMAVEGLRIGDVLRVSYSVTRKDPALQGNVQSAASLLTQPAPVQFARVRLLWPQAANLKWKLHVKNAPVQASDAGGYHELVVPLPLAKPADLPQDAPARFQYLPLIEATSFASWREVAEEMAPLYNDAAVIEAGSPLADEVAKIEKASADPRTRAALALQLVQDKVRYLFSGMEGGNYIPQKPAKTWSVRYGDCKAKTLLLLAMLRKLGIDADAALVSSKLGDLLPQRLPMPGAFDHVIVRATIGGETLWLDGTSSGDRLADLGDTPAFRHALPLKTGSDLVDMPFHRAARPTFDTQVELDQSAGINFPAPYTIKITARGPIVEVMRLGAAKAGKDKLNEVIDKLVSSYIGTNSAVDRQMRFDDTAGTVILSASGVAYPEWPRESERYKNMLDRTVNDMNFAPDRSRTAWKEIPVAAGDAMDIRIRTRIHLPDNGTGFTIEGNQVLPATLAGAAVDRKTSLADGWLTVEDRISSGLTEIKPAEIPAVREQVARAKAKLLRAVAPADYPARWRQVGMTRKAKGFDRILAVYAQAIADKPDEVEPLTNRAWFLETIYDRAGAVRDLDKAIAIAPSVELYLRRADHYWSLGQGDKALADVLAARELDPGSVEALSKLAWIRGERGETDQALALVDERIEAGGKEKPDFMSQKSDILADAGRAEDALALIDEAVAANPGNPGLLNSRCWLKGTHKLALDTALRDCTKAIELSDGPAAVLDSRAMVYFQMGRMDDALADLNAALDLEPELSASLYLRGVILKRKGDAAGDADLVAARMMSPRIDEKYAKYGIKP